MESLKINYILPVAGRTGGIRSLLNFMNELSRMGHEVYMTTLYYNKWFPLSPDVNVISKRTFFDAGYYFKMSTLSKKKKVMITVSMLHKLNEMIPKTDINIATFAPTAYLASLKSIEGTTPFYHMQHFETIMFDEPIMKKFVSDTYFLPIYKIANSIWLRDRLYDFTGKKYPIVNPAIEHDIFYKRKDGISDQSDKIINIVALGKGGWKNLDGIYNAVNQVRLVEKDKKIILHLFGHKPIENIPFDGQYTIFHKDLNDEELASLYSSCDIQITFSKAESFPLPPLEAMACGTAVITTQYGTEDYAVDGENAIIVEPDNVDMLENKLKMLIDDTELRRKIRDNGIKTAKKFNYTKQAKILETEIQKALDENTSNDLKSKII
jgi:glycosyltransferase involved in cell wall biosynthesis